MCATRIAHAARSFTGSCLLRSLNQRRRSTTVGAGGKVSSTSVESFHTDRSARIAALANPGEVLVSAPTASLLEGGGLLLEDAGEHELKGLPGARRVYRLLGFDTD